MDSSNEPVSEADLEALMAELGPTKMKAVISSCPECLRNSREGNLRQYSVNLEDCMVFCDNDKCCYMANETDTHVPDNQSADDLIDVFTSMLTAGPEVSTSPSPSISDSLTQLTSQSASKSDSLFEGADSSSPPQTSIVPTDVISTTHSPVATDSSDYPTDASNENVTPSLENAAMDIGVDNQHLFNTTSMGSSSAVTDGRSCLPVLTEPTVCASPVSVESVTHKTSTAKYKYIMLWANIDALCWLDVLLATLVHNHSLRQLSQSLPYSSVVKKLLVAYDESQALIDALQEGEESLLHSVLEHDKVSVKRGGGYCMDTSSSLLESISSCTVLTPQQIKCAKRKIHLAGIKLECVREEIWQAIEPPLRCERGKDDSPVFAFPLILGTDKMVEEMFSTDYKWTVTCKVCHHQQISRKSKPMLTFPKVAMFDINKCMYHHSDCVKCLAPNQKRELTFTRLSHNLVVHFSDGMLFSDVDRLSFTSHAGVKYIVSAVIEYKTSPNHFALWQRDITHSSGKWMCYDDLHSQYAQFSLDTFSVPAPHIHIVFWEALPNQLPLVSAANQPGSTLPDRVHVKTTLQATSKIPTAKNSVKRTMLSPPVMSHNVAVEAKAPAPALSSISKSLKVSRNSGSQSSGSKKPVALVSEQVGVKRQLTQSIKYGVTPKQEATTYASQTSSHKNILSTLSLMTPGRHDTTKVKTKSAPAAIRQPKVNGGKSYLDIVKPLLQKNREQSGKVLSAYVPKNKRETVQVEPESKRKRVMFRGVPSPTPPTNSSKEKDLHHNSKSSVGGPRSAPSKITKRMQKMSLLRDDVPVRTLERQRVIPAAQLVMPDTEQQEHVVHGATDEDIESLEDILDKLSH